MHLKDFDKLSLQRLLLTVAGGIGGTWRPVISIAEDVCIGSREEVQLVHNRKLVIEHRMTAMQTEHMQQPALVMSRELECRTSAYEWPARVNVLVTATCSFADADAVMTAIDECSEQLDSKVRELRAAMEERNV